MEDRCIFCGEELSLLKRKKLYCGGIGQTVCGKCFQKYSGCTPAERARLALETGRAASADELRAYVDHMDAVQEKRQQQEQEKRQQRDSGRICLRCGERMLQYRPVTLKLGKETYLFSDLNRLITGSLDVKVLRCENCGMAEFYIPDDKELLQAGKEEQD